MLQATTPPPSARQPKPTTPSPYPTKTPTTPSQKKQTPRQPATLPISSTTPPHPITPTNNRQHNPKNTHRNHSHNHPQKSLSQSRHNNLQNNRRQKYKTTMPTPHLKRPPTSALSPALATIAFNQPRGFNRNRFQELQIRPKNHPTPPNTARAPPQSAGKTTRRG